MEEKVLRPGNNRRSGKDRRMFHDPDYKGPERRSGKDRRSWRDRRSSWDRVWPCRCSTVAVMRKTAGRLQLTI